VPPTMLKLLKLGVMGAPTLYEIEDFYVLGPNFNGRCGPRISFVCTTSHYIWKYESKVMAMYLVFLVNGQFG